MATTPVHTDLPPAYEPATVESRVYDAWEQGGYFAPSDDPARTPYSLIMPPPNVTGELHLGHGLEDAISDALIRWHRMMGDAALWLPGEDHAGIATQNVIEKELAKEGLTRHDLGREAFVERTWQWVRKYRSRIYEQHRKLGASADWSRNTFTLDPNIVRAVRTTFVDLYNDGLIYRGLRMTNWCPRCATALSDLEVDYEEEQAKLYYIRYPMVGEGGMPLPDTVMVATTRPETMVADTGIAVHPDDERYEEQIGRMFLLPIIGREIPLVGDDAVSAAFGTGAVKVTPGHDPNDWEIGQRNDLPVIIAIDREGLMNDEAGPYAGMTEREAREAILRDLADEGFLDHEEDYIHSVGKCSRCKTVVQPIPTEQWWVDVHKEFAPGRSLASAAAAAVRNGDIQITPARFARDFLNWMDNLRDWCISRQLWWGHRVPVWYCAHGHTIASVEDIETCPECDGAVRQDEDVLDTWFSSGLAPHADLGWPDRDAPDLTRFYPTADMQMGYDIMFFWCARMVMFGLYNMRYLGDDSVPFRNVLFHGLIRDAKGEKMTKSRGNVVDPLLAASKYGADAFRFGLLTAGTIGQDMKYNDERLESARNFANKLWNSTRYVLMRTGDRMAQPLGDTDPSTLAVEDRWILSRLTGLETDVDSLLRAYQIGEAGRRIEDFLRGEFCDWYIEMSKVRLNDGDERPLDILAHVLDRGIRLLHPFMPFVTEELWQALRPRMASSEPSLMLIAARFPVADDRLRDDDAERGVAHVIEVNRIMRNVRAESGLPAGERPRVFLRAAEFQDVLAATAAATAFTSRVEPVIVSADTPLPEGNFGFGRVATTEIAVELPAVDVGAERERLGAELAEAEAYVAKLAAQLGNEQFISRAPEAVVAGARARHEEAQAKAAGLRERLAQL